METVTREREAPASADTTKRHHHCWPWSDVALCGFLRNGTPVTWAQMPDTTCCPECRFVAGQQGYPCNCSSTTGGV